MKQHWTISTWDFRLSNLLRKKSVHVHFFWEHLLARRLSSKRLSEPRELRGHTGIKIAPPAGGKGTTTARLSDSKAQLGVLGSLAVLRNPESSLLCLLRMARQFAAVGRIVPSNLRLVQGPEPCVAST